MTISGTTGVGAGEASAASPVGAVVVEPFESTSLAVVTPLHPASKATRVAAVSEAEEDREPDHEDEVRARLRQIRQDSAHIPVAEEPEPGLLNKIKWLLGRR